MLDLYDCKYTKKHMDVYEGVSDPPVVAISTSVYLVAEDAVFEDVFMRLTGVPPIRTAFSAMVDLLTPHRIAAHIDLHTYDPQECAASSGAAQLGTAANFTPGISTTAAVGSTGKASTPQAPPANASDAQAAPAAQEQGASAAAKKQLPEGAIVISPILHATDRAIVLRLQYTYSTLWGTVTLPFHSIVRLYIREATADDDESAPRAEHLRYKIVRHEDLLYGHDLLSWRNGGPAGALFNLLRGANGALFYVVYSFFSA